MNVQLAVKVLSESVANILRNYYPYETQKTAELCERLITFLVYSMFEVV